MNEEAARQKFLEEKKRGGKKGKVRKNKRKVELRFPSSSSRIVLNKVVSKI